MIQPSKYYYDMGELLFNLKIAKQYKNVQYKLSYVKIMHKRKPERKHAKMLTVVIVNFFFMLFYIFHNEHMLLLTSGEGIVYYLFSEKL